MKAMLIAVAMRFGRAFVYGAVAQMAVYAVQTQSVATLKDFQVWGYALVTSGIVGGILAVDKALRYEVPQE